MNYLDIIFIVPLIWAGFRGFKKGFIIEVSAVIAFGLGVWGGIHFSDFVAELLSDSIESKYVPLASFAFTFIIIVATVFVLGKMLEKAVNFVQLKLVNKLAGALFGVAKIVLVISVMLVIVNSFDQKANIVPKDLKENSVLYKPLSGVALKVIPALKNSELFSDSATRSWSDSSSIGYVQ